MSEFTAPSIQNNFTDTRLLSNITDSSIMLQLYDSPTADVQLQQNITQFESDEIKFYNDIVNSDTTSPLYNQPKIQSYVDSGILSDTIFNPQSPNATFNGMTGSCHSISNNLKKTSQPSKQDHLEIFYSTDTNNKLKILVYRDIDGISYSLDGGNSIQSIPMTGIMYPAEITSVAIQNFQTINATGNLKIWIGTLREGLFSYTFGNTSWISESNLEKTTDGLDPASPTYSTDILAGKFLFKESLINKIAIPAYNNLIPTPYEVVESDGKRYLYKQDPDGTAYKYQIASDGNIYNYIPGNYEPIYILGIVNNPISAGIPLVLYVNSHTQISTGLDLDSRYIYKYLLSESYVYTYDSIYNTYRISTELTYNDYNGAITAPTWNSIASPTSNMFIDVLKTVQIQPTQNITSNTSGILSAISVYISTLQRFCVELFKITVTNHVVSTSGTNRGVTLTSDTYFSSTQLLDANNFSGLSTFDTTLFITEKTKIWRYYNNSWQLWLAVDDTIDEKNTRITPDYKFSVVGSTSYISGLKGFGILQTPTQNYYTGILNTDLGHLTFNLVSTTTDFMSPITGTKQLRRDLFPTSVRDLQVISELNICISCGLKTEFLSVYKISSTYFGSPIRTFLISPNVSTNISNNLSKQIQSIFYKNYSYIGETPILYNKYNSFTITSLNTDQLYSNIESQEFILLFKDLLNTIQYVDSTVSFSWLQHDISTSTGPTIFNDSLLIDYISSSSKYTRLKLLLQATETVSFNDYILRTNTEIPIILDFDYQITGTLLATTVIITSPV